MAKITASGLAKSEPPYPSVYIVNDAEGVRPANRKDHARRIATLVTDVQRVGESRVYRVTTTAGEMLAQGSQYFDIAEESSTTIDTYVPEVPEQPDTDTVMPSPLAALHDEILRLKNEVYALRVQRDQLLEANRAYERNSGGFNLIADQVGILHAAYDAREKIECEIPIRTVTVIATGVRTLSPGRKVCPKCEQKVRSSAV